MATCVTVDRKRLMSLIKTGINKYSKELQENIDFDLRNSSNVFDAIMKEIDFEIAWPNKDL